MGLRATTGLDISGLEAHSPACSQILLHRQNGAQSFSRSHYVFGYPSSQHFMEPECSPPCSQEPATSLCPHPHDYSPQSHPIYLKPILSPLSLFWKNIIGLWYHVAVCVSPISLPDNGSVKIPLSLLGNGPVKIPLSLLGNGSVETLPR
jgi:hypothetical protein